MSSILQGPFITLITIGSSKRALREVQILNFSSTLNSKINSSKALHKWCLRVLLIKCLLHWKSGPKKSMACEQNPLSEKPRLKILYLLDFSKDIFGTSFI